MTTYFTMKEIRACFIMKEILDFNIPWNFQPCIGTCSVQRKVRTLFVIKQTKPCHKAIISRLSNLWMVPKSYALFHWSCKQPYVEVRHSVSNCEICFPLLSGMTHTILKTFLKFFCHAVFKSLWEIWEFFFTFFSRTRIFAFLCKTKNKNKQPTNQQTKTRKLFITAIPKEHKTRPSLSYNIVVYLRISLIYRESGEHYVRIHPAGNTCQKPTVKKLDQTEQIFAHRVGLYLVSIRGVFRTHKTSKLESFLRK